MSQTQKTREIVNEWKLKVQKLLGHRTIAVRQYNITRQLKLYNCQPVKVHNEGVSLNGIIYEFIPYETYLTMQKYDVSENSGTFEWLPRGVIKLWMHLSIKYIVIIKSNGTLKLFNSMTKMSCGTTFLWSKFNWIFYFGNFLCISAQLIQSVVCAIIQHPLSANIDLTIVTFSYSCRLQTLAVITTLLTFCLVCCSPNKRLKQRTWTWAKYFFGSCLGRISLTYICMYISFVIIFNN